MRKQELHPRTAAINQKQKNLSKLARLEALQWLAASFPESFNNSMCIRPLKLGIMDDILAYADKAAEAGVSKGKLREAVVIFTRRIDYLTCLKSREMRIDLHGNAVEPVTEDEAERAAAKIKKRVEKSAKNARKSMQLAKSTHTKSPSQLSHASLQEASPHFAEPVSSFGVQNCGVHPMRTAPITIKHKQTRQYDPDAVARLKEKLGISRKNEEQTELN